jgi:sortase A
MATGTDKGADAGPATAIGELAPEGSGPGRRRRATRRLGTTLMVLGVLVIAYAGVILVWGDPFTALYADWRQQGLSHTLNGEIANWPVEPAVAALRASGGGQASARTRITGLRVLRHDAAAFAHRLKGGQPFGRLTIGRIGLKVVVVQGTDWLHDLSQGPGHYSNTHFPGQGTTVAIAGHRTTFGAWFRHINDIRNGDYITLQMPYATFRYRVQYHVVVPNTDWSIIRPHGYERLVLSACHPLYSSSHRWIVFARGVSATLKGGLTVPLTG